MRGEAKTRVHGCIVYPLLDRRRRSPSVRCAVGVNDGEIHNPMVDRCTELSGQFLFEAALRAGPQRCRSIIGPPHRLADSWNLAGW